MLGLSPGQLVAASTVAGAVGGAAVDAAVGGASFMAGAVVGAAVGGGAAVYGIGRRLARVRQVFPGGLAGFVLGARRAAAGSRRFRIGPHAGANFPWVLLDRALLHYDAVAGCTHARRGTIVMRRDGDRAGLVSGLARAERRDLEAIFRDLRRSAGDPARETCAALERRLERILSRIDPVPGDESPP